MTAKIAPQLQEYRRQVDSWRAAGWRFLCVLEGQKITVHRIAPGPCRNAAIETAVARGGVELTPSNNVNAATRCPLCVRRLA